MQVGQVPEALPEVEAVPDEELVRYREADVAHGQVMHEASVRTVEEAWRPALSAGMDAYLTGRLASRALLRAFSRFRVAHWCA